MKRRHARLCFITIAIIFSALVIHFSICFEERFRIFLRGKIPHNPNISTLIGTSWNQFSQNQPHNCSFEIRHLIYKSTTFPRRRENFLIFTTVGSDKMLHGNFNWRHLRTVESIFYHHPTAEINMYSNTLPNTTFNALTELGYSIQIHRYDFKRMLIGTPAEGFRMKLENVRNGGFWYDHEADLVRILLFCTNLVAFTCMDTDIIVVNHFMPWEGTLQGGKTKIWLQIMRLRRVFKSLPKRIFTTLWWSAMEF